MSRPSRDRVLVIGGGVIGAACAYYLARAGRPVTLVDRGSFGAGASHGNCGYVCPSHVLPLCAPGAIRQTLGALFQPNSPFAIRPRWDWGLWTWLLRFALNCREDRMLAAARSRHVLHQSSRALYQELMGPVLTDCDWEQRGILFVYQTPREFEHYAAVDQKLRREFGLAATPIEGDALTTFEPALKPGLAGAWLYETDAHLRPEKLMAAWRRTLESADVEIREHCAVQDFQGEASRGTMQRVASSTGPLEASEFVIAAGAWSSAWAKSLGCRIPLQPGKGYSVTMPRPALCPQRPVIFEEHRVAVTPWASGYRIGSTMEFTGFDERINRRRLALLTDGAAHYLREPLGQPVLEEWGGFRPMSCDELPLIGRAPRWKNLHLATGHGMLGVSWAPATGKLLAELVTGQPPHIDPAPYRVERFG